MSVEGGVVITVRFVAAEVGGRVVADAHAGFGAWSEVVESVDTSAVAVEGCREVVGSEVL